VELHYNWEWALEASFLMVHGSRATSVSQRWAAFLSQNRRGFDPSGGTEELSR
jgi:hypothetical protein